MEAGYVAGGLSSLMFAIAFPTLIPHSKVKTSEALGEAILTGGRE